MPQMVQVASTAMQDSRDSMNIQDKDSKSIINVTAINSKKVTIKSRETSKRNSKGTTLQGVGFKAIDS
jgi:hypothetical protein